jgi:Xaa-Pro aminopeptidase
MWMRDRYGGKPTPEQQAASDAYLKMQREEFAAIKEAMRPYLEAQEVAMKAFRAEVEGAASDVRVMM